MFNPKWLGLYDTFGFKSWEEAYWDRVDIEKLKDIYDDDTDFGMIYDRTKTTLEDYLSMKHVI